MLVANAPLPVLMASGRGTCYQSRRRKAKGDKSIYNGGPLLDASRNTMHISVSLFTSTLQLLPCLANLMVVVSRSAPPVNPDPFSNFNPNVADTRRNDLHLIFCNFMRSPVGVVTMDLPSPIVQHGTRSSRPSEHPQGTVPTIVFRLPFLLLYWLAWPAYSYAGSPGRPPRHVTRVNGQRPKAGEKRVGVQCRARMQTPI